MFVPSLKTTKSPSFSHLVGGLVIIFASLLPVIAIANEPKSLGKYKPIVLIVEPNCDVITKYNRNGSTIKELIEFGTDFGYDFLGMSGIAGRHNGNVYLIRNDYKDNFDICNKPWQQRGIILSEGVLY